MSARKTRAYARSLAGALVLGAVLLSGCSRAPQPAAEQTAAAPGEEQAEPGLEGSASEQDASEPLRRVLVRLYFPSASGEGLVGESREIFHTAMPGDRAKQILSDLIAGPGQSGSMRAVPKGTRLRQVYVLENGVAYVDFSSELTDQMGGGSTREILTVYSIVDSVALNLPEVRRVGILVNGRTVETLNGHLDLRRPLPPDRKWILRANAAPQPPAPPVKRASHTLASSPVLA